MLAYHACLALYLLHLTLKSIYKSLLLISPPCHFQTSTPLHHCISRSPPVSTISIMPQTPTPAPVPVPVPTPNPTSIRTVLLCHQIPHDHGTNPPTHDLNLMIIVAALFCAFICALGLNSMLQCVFQCANRALTEPVQWVASRRLNSGLKKKDMIALPTSTYSNSSGTSSPSLTSSCAICLLDFSDGDKIRLLPKCNHRFHVVCIDKWLLSHSSCPTCRHRLKSSGDSKLSLSEIVTT